MIGEKEIFEEVRDNISLMCRDDCLGSDLAAAIGLAVSHKMKSVCVTPNRVNDVWPWLEKTKIKIISRFYIDKPINDDFISDLSGKISASFRDGADGAMIFVRKRDLQKFVSGIGNIRNDLFFNKYFNIAIDIDEIDTFDWDELFRVLQSVKVDALVLTFSNDTGDKSDFVGRLFAMLNASRANWDGCVNFVFGENTIRIDQTYRLIQQICPETLSKTEFFVDNE